MAQKQQDLYKGQITEFIDWITGSNLLGLEGVGKAVSGGSIRQLLQEKVQRPIYLYYDESERMYRIFSSEASKNLWLQRTEYPDKNLESLELGSFIAPSPYSLNIYEYNSKTTFNTNSRNVRSEENTNDTKLRFSWEVLQDESPTSDNLIATYTIVNDGEQSFIERYGNGEPNVEVDLSPYLKNGVNTVHIKFQGENTKVTKNLSITINSIVLSISSDFNYAQTMTGIINVPYYLESSSGLERRVANFYVDYEKVSDYTFNKAENNLWKSFSLNTTQFQTTGKHTLSIVVIATTSDNKSFYSNTLYFEIMIFPSESASSLPTVLTSSSFLISGIMNSNDAVIQATQYKAVTLKWGYTSNSASIDTQEIVWYLEDLSGGRNKLSIISATQHSLSPSLIFLPTVETNNETWKLKAYLKGKEDQTSIGEIGIIIEKSQYVVTEISGYNLKLSALGKTNSDPTWTYGSITTDFQNFSWDSRSGWVNNALKVSKGSVATINFNPLADLTNGSTIEIEFSTANVSNPNETLICIGDVNGIHIKITPNSASLETGASEGNTFRIKTNFREGERVKLAFIFNGSSNDNATINDTVFIVNNGILERVSSYQKFSLSNANIKIGRTDSSSTIFVYNIRCYSRNLSYENAFMNFAFDSENVGQIISRNNILDVTGDIDYESIQTQLDVILLTGDLESILSSSVGKEKEISATIQRVCLADPKKSFVIKNGKIRKHGQSTLNYPVPSFKIWSDSPVDDTVPYGMYQTSSVNNCSKDNQIYKGRYSMKDDSIPSKKWVLQANYADSSGVHNGGIQRLIQDTWYNAVIDGEYKLRTEPQLVASSKQVTIVDSGGNTALYPPTSQLWNSKHTTDFPYKIRVSPDSFPCVIFYRQEETSGWNFLGQYVFMDDKKSDYVYGERSIYNIANDPFCLLESNKGKDTNDNKLWDNSKVLRLEVLNVNTPFVDYRSLTDGNGNRFDLSLNTQRNWESDFELIYPDRDNYIPPEGTKTYTDFLTRVSPFEDWFKWIVGTYKNHTEFRNTAARHLDLYKLAAYYIFVLKFGLVDSLERNAQLKTYDGQHWWYEPWDMDIAMGNRNTGGIAFDPPIDRNTYEGIGDSKTYAISGKTSDTVSNWLFDALEAWTTEYEEDGITIKKEGWIDSIVPKVAKALNKAGLTYDKVIQMLDEEYSEKWCERVYNKNGYFKYIESGSGSYYPWCQGARTSHRHWWLSTSMNYWDAKWQMGEFEEKYIYLAVEASGSTYRIIKFNSCRDSYFALHKTDTHTTLSFKEVKEGEQGEFTFTGITTKTPLHLQGANYVQTLDLRGLEGNIDIVDLSHCYSSEMGSALRKLIVGSSTQNLQAGIGYNSKELKIPVDNGGNMLKEITYFDMQGTLDTRSIPLAGMASLQELYALGSNLSEFPKSDTGSNYKVLQLPTTLKTLTLYDSSWEEGQQDTSVYNGWKGLTFWKQTTNADGKTYTFTPYTQIQSDLMTLNLLGKTGNYDCSRKLVLNWIASLTDDQIKERNLTIDSVNWADGNVSYEQVCKLAKFNNGNPKSIKGYILLSDSSLSSPQIQNLQTLFGNSVFTKNTGGLMIDCAMNDIIITVGQPAQPIYDITGTKIEGYKIEEGYDSNGRAVRALLQATKFMSQETDSNYTWSLAPINQGASIIQDGGSYYLQVAEMRLMNHNPINALTLTCTLDTQTTVIPITVIHHAYPANIEVVCTPKVPIVKGVYKISEALDSGYRFTTSLKYNAGEESNIKNTIVSQEWTLENSMTLTNVSIDAVKTNSYITLYVSNTDPVNTVLTYTITFKSGEKMVKKLPIQVGSAAVILTSNSNEALYNALLTAGVNNSDTGYTEYNLQEATSINIPSSNDSAQYVESVKSTIDGTTYIVPNYFTGAKTINLSGLSNSEAATINVSTNESLQSLNLSNTLLGVKWNNESIVGDSGLPSFQLGAPQEINLSYNATVNPEITITDFSQLSSLTINNPYVDSGIAFTLLVAMLNSPSYIDLYYKGDYAPTLIENGKSMTLDVTSDGEAKSILRIGNGSYTMGYSTVLDTTGATEGTEFIVYMQNANCPSITNTRYFYIQSSEGATTVLSNKSLQDSFNRSYYLQEDEKMTVNITLNEGVSAEQGIIAITSKIASCTLKTTSSGYSVTQGVTQTQNSLGDTNVITIIIDRTDKVTVESGGNSVELAALTNLQGVQTVSVKSLQNVGSISSIIIEKVTS